MTRHLLLLSLLAALAICAGAQRPAPQPAPQPPRTISVTGSAERMVTPDVATMSLAIVTQGETVAKAVADNNTTARHITDAINQLKITGLTLRTTGFEVAPMYEVIREPAPTTTRPPRIIGFQVTNQVEARIVNTNENELSAAASQVLDAGTNAGANRVDSLTFSLADSRPVMRALQAEATRDASSSAHAIATAAGVKLGPPMSISATPYYEQPLGMTYARAEAASSVPISIGQMTVRATVNAVYVIK